MEFGIGWLWWKSDYGFCFSGEAGLTDSRQTRAYCVDSGVFGPLRMTPMTNSSKTLIVSLLMCGGLLCASAGSVLAKPAAPVAPVAPATAPGGTGGVTVTSVGGPPIVVKATQPGQPAQPAAPTTPPPSGATGQTKPFELPARMQQPAAPPPFSKPEMPVITSTDSDVLAVTGMLKGSFKVAAAGDTPARVLHATPITLTGFDNAMYFELTREDSPMTSYRSGVWFVYKQTLPGAEPALVLRVMDFDKLAPTFGQAMTGLWLAPEYFPAITASQVRPTQDIALRRVGESFEGNSLLSPTTAGGATVFSTTVKIGRDGITWQDKGFDAAGKMVFGSAAADVFTPFTPNIKVVKNDENGLVQIDFREGEAGGPAAADGFDLFVHYTGWTAADGNQFDSSRERDPMKMTLPGALIAGWNMGIPGIKQGGYRKLIIPGALGYGTRGNPRAKIAPMATLIFDTEAVYVKQGEPKPATPEATK